MKKIKKFFKTFYKAWNILSDNEPLILCSSTSYFALFAVPAILVIIISILGVIYEPAIISGELFSQLEEVLGAETSEQLEEVIVNMREMDPNWKITTFSIAIFLISSTTLFTVMQKSINRIWEIKPKPQSNILNMLKNRLFALVVIFAGGILAIASVLSEIVVSFLSSFVDSILGIGIIVFELMSRVVSLLIFTLWFALAFKLLPDAKVKWKHVWIGAFLTSILFLVGMIVLQMLFLGRLDDWWGGVSSFVFILIFIFYTSWLVYYGAAFTRAFIESKGKKIEPESYARVFEIKEV
ncbi:MAG: YihY/virulence factor BrkB family protein [Bacteroidetes bacterium]|nr:YihY/virulence factor BrkB family protein [Bacteroidota bacterium]